MPEGLKYTVRALETKITGIQIFLYILKKGCEQTNNKTMYVCKITYEIL